MIDCSICFLTRLRAGCLVLMISFENSFLVTGKVKIELQDLSAKL